MADNFYAECRKAYRPDDPGDGETLRQFTVRVCRPGEHDQWLPGGEEWLERLRTLADAVQARFEDPEEIYHPPGLAPDRDPVLRLRAPEEVDGCVAVAEAFVDALERHLYRSAVAVDKFHIFRHRPGVEVEDKSAGSWGWHVDGHPLEFVKVIVYLSDVTPGSSTFQYLWHEEKQRALRAAAQPMASEVWEPNQARTGGAVSQAALMDRLARGYEPVPVYGELGSTIIFNTNLVHRGAPGDERTRDSLLLRLRPALVRPEPLLSASLSQAETVHSGGVAIR